jgi:hypothetical protein
MEPSVSAISTPPGDGAIRPAGYAGKHRDESWGALGLRNDKVAARIQYDYGERCKPQPARLGKRGIHDLVRPLEAEHSNVIPEELLFAAVILVVTPALFIVVKDLLELFPVQRQQPVEL